jgi:uncharacterized coiled-coil DUF342 family protein
MYSQLTRTEVIWMLYPLQISWLIITFDVHRFFFVWTLPSRRQDVKKKIYKVADNIGRQLSNAMQSDLQESLDNLREEIKALTTPYRKAAEAERARVIALQSRLGELDSELRSLRQKVQNLGT